MKPGRVMRFVTIALAWFILAVTGTLSLTQPAFATGDVSVQRYCEDNYAGASPYAYLKYNNAYGWRCKIRWHIFWQEVEVSMLTACKQQHGISSVAYLRNNDPSSPYNWPYENRMSIIEFIKMHKYKLGQAICLTAALVITYISVQNSMSGLSGKDPNVAVHVLSFCVVILLVIGAIYFRYKDNR